jgi:hypothetical protein
MLFSACVLALVAAVRAAPSQYPLQHPIVDANEEDITTLSHDHFPGHKIRAVQPRGFCDSTVEQWSGYLDTPNDRHFYFWLAEASKKLFSRVEDLCIPTS